MKTAPKQYQRRTLAPTEYDDTTYSFIVAMADMGHALTVMSKAKTRPHTRWVNRVTGTALSQAVIDRLRIAMNGSEEDQEREKALIGTAGLLVIFDDADDAMMFKLSL